MADVSSAIRRLEFSLLRIEIQETGHPPASVVCGFLLPEALALRYGRLRGYQSTLGKGGISALFGDKELFMRGRMPFPDPFLPFGIAAMIVGLIVPTCLQLTQKLKVQNVPNENPSKTESGTNVSHEGRTVTHQDSTREHWETRIHPPKGWIPADRPLADYVIANPGRPIIVSFGAKWTSSSTFGWRILATDGVTEALQDAEFVCLVADLTGGNELATDEMRRLGRVALPVTAVYDPTTEKWEPKPEVFSAADVFEWATLLKARIAEQPADGKTPEATPLPH